MNKLHLRAPNAFILALSLVSSQAIAADSSKLLSRSSNWEIQYDKEACHLIGTFGRKGDEVIVRFSKSERGDFFRLALYGAAFSSAVRDNTLSLDFGQEKGPAIVTAQAGMAGDLPVMIAQTSFNSSGKLEPIKFSLADIQKVRGKTIPQTVDPEREAAVTRLVVGTSDGRSINLQLGSMGAPMASMRTCVDDLIKSWGYDPDVISNLTMKPTPKGSIGNWLSYKDFPQLAIARGKSGIIRFRLDVDANGKVRKCTILEQLAGPEFNDATCANIMRRAHLNPALDSNGKPTAAYYTASVNWLSPR